MPRRMSEELCQKTLDDVARYGSEVQAAHAEGISRATLQSRVRAAKAYGFTAKVEHKDSPAQLKDQIKRLTAELKHADQQSSDLETIKGIIGGIAGKVETFKPPKWLITPQGKSSAPGVPTLFLSDLHWGETVYPSQINGVNEYSIRIAKDRMATLVDSAVHLLKIISPNLDYPGIVLPLGGDMISGNLHDELTATNELNSMPTVLDLYGVLIGVIDALADQFGAVFLPCVSGNHGRDTKRIWAKDRHATSFDWLIYKFLEKHFENDKRITFYIPDGIAAHYKVYGYRFRLSHGDKLGKGGDGIIGMLGPVIRGDHRTRSRDAQIDLGYDTQIIGHFHQYTHTQRVIVNGTLKGMDEYAYVEGFPFEQPQQALWINNPRHGITFRMPVYVDCKRAPAKTSWISVPE